jgi:TolB-like protein
MAARESSGALIPVAVTGVLFAGVIALWITNGPGTQAPTIVATEPEQVAEVLPQPQSVDPLGFSFAILPFLLTADSPVSAATAAELTGLVTYSLAEIEGVRVIARAEAAVFAPEAERPGVQAISEALEVRYVYQARIEGNQNNVIINTQLADGRTGEVLYLKTYRAPIDAVLDLFRPLTEAIWDEFDMEFSGLL